MDLISRQAAIEALGERPIVWTDDDQYTLGERNQYDTNRLAIETLPSAEKVGKWILADWQVQEEIDNGNYCYHCSNCGKADIHAKSAEVPFCWWCGARMEGEEDEAD